MHTVYLGYSTNFNADEMIQFFDIDPLHKDGISKFEQEFGCSYIQPGSFEVYGRDKYEPRGFNTTLLKHFLPFQCEMDLLEKIDFQNSKCVFFLVTNSITRMAANGIFIVGKVDVQKFDYE